MKLVIISGSRNPEGQTARAADALLRGVVENGGVGEVVYLPPMHIQRCRQCGNDGWGTCRTNGRCVIEDDFPWLVDTIASADAVVFATPVYYSDLSESLRAFLDRLRRTATNEDGRKKIEGKPAVGICVAGGGGGGAPECVARMDWILRTAGFDVVDLIPVRRQNLDAKILVLEQIGKWLATRNA